MAGYTAARENIDRYNTLKRYDNLIEKVEHVNNRVLGVVTILMIIDLFCQSLKLDLELYIPHPVLIIIEITAQALAVISIALFCLLYFFRYKVDGFRKMYKAVLTDYNRTSYPNCNGKSGIHYYGRPIDKNNHFNEVETVAILGAQAYIMGNTAKSRRVIRLNKWLKADDKCVVLFESEYNEIVGYLCTLGLDDSAGSKGEAHYNGHCEEFEIEEDYVTNKNTRMILVQGIGLNSAFMNDAIEPFLECFYEQLARHMPMDDKLVQSTKIYVEPISYFNIKFFKELGFVETGRKSKSGNKLLELSFSENAVETDKGFYTKQRIKFYLQIRRNRPQ